MSIFEAIGKNTGMTWQLAGYMMIIYISQLESIPESYLEAAKIDGATTFL